MILVGLQVQPVVGYAYEPTTVICTDTGITTGDPYSWLKDSLIIYSQNNEGTIKDGKYLGTTQPGQLSLQVLNTSRSDAGQYQCNYNFKDAFGTLSLAYKPASLTYTASRRNGLQLLNITAVKVYPNSSSINSVFCENQISQTTETFNASQTIISNNEDTFLFDINWIGTTLNVSPTDDYICTVNFTLIVPYVTTLNVSFTAAERDEGKKDCCFCIGWKKIVICIIIPIIVVIIVICIIIITCWLCKGWWDCCYDCSGTTGYCGCFIACLSCCFNLFCNKKKTFKEEYGIEAVYVPCSSRAIDDEHTNQRGGAHDGENHDTRNDLDNGSNASTSNVETQVSQNQLNTTVPQRNHTSKM